MLLPYNDPMSEKSYRLNFNKQEELLWKILEAACGEECPPDNIEYLCDTKVVASEDEEAELCTQCYLNWAAKAGTPSTPFAKRLFEAIKLACDNECPPDIKDYLCQADAAEDTSSDNCTKCLMRWASKPFWMERTYE